MEQEKAPPSLEKKLPPVVNSNSGVPVPQPPSTQQQSSSQFFSPPPPHSQQQIYQGVPPSAAAAPSTSQSYSQTTAPPPPYGFSPEPGFYPPPSVAYPAPVPVPPPGSIHAAPGYDFATPKAEDISDWCVIENDPHPVPPSIHAGYGQPVSSVPMTSSMMLPPPSGYAPQGSYAPPASMGYSTTQSTVVSAGGSDAPGFLYPAIPDTSRFLAQQYPQQQATVFVVPGAQLAAPAAQTHAFNPFSQQPEAVVTFAPFEVTPEAANALYVKWKEGLWFTPADFGSKSCEAELKPILIPYYLFDVSLSTSYSGQIGFVETSITTSTHHHHHHGRGRRGGHHHGSNVSTSTTVRWRNASGCKSGSYNSILAIGSVVMEDYEKLNKVDGWRLESLVSAVMRTDQLGPAVDWSHAFYREGGALSMLEISEKSACSSLLRQDNHADRVQDVHLKLSVTGLSYRVAYLPIYLSVFSYEGKVFKVFINGQSGKIYGERPYGVGGLVNGLKTIGSLFKKAEKPTIISGVELQSLDNITIYNPNSHFVVLPPSDTQLKIQSVGYVTLQNTGPSPIQLVSQRRGAQVQGGAFVLAPGATKSFDFIGRWVIEVIGAPSSLRIVEYATKGGNKGNALGMKL